MLKPIHHEMSEIRNEVEYSGWSIKRQHADPRSYTRLN